MKTVFACVAFAALLFLCESVKPPTTPVDVFKARAKWRKSAPAVYKYRLSTRCEDFKDKCTKGFIPGATGGTYHVSVKGRKVTKVEQRFGFDDIPTKGFLSIDGILRQVARLIGKKDGSTVLAVFDEKTGFPSKITVASPGKNARVYDNTFIYTTEQQLERLNKAKALWAAVKPSEYKFELKRFCFICGPPLTITVKDGVATAEGAEFSDSPVGTKAITIDQLFDEIEEDINRDPDFYAIDYDPITGVPLDCSHDPIFQAIDDESGFTVEFLTDLS